MRRFISILLKLFKKDYDSKKIKRGGYGEFNYALNYSDLDYSRQFQLPLAGIKDNSVF